MTIISIHYDFSCVSVRVSVRDGSGPGRNKFAGRVQNHHLRFSFHVHRTRNYGLLEMVKTAAKLLLQVWTLCVASYAKYAIVGAYHRTSDGQEHKIIWRAGLERHTIFSLTCHSVQRARQPLSRLACMIASPWQGTLCSSSFVSKVLGANYNRANNFHPVADKFAMCTDKK